MAVNGRNVNLLTVITLILFIIGLISAIVPTAIAGTAALTWLFAGLVSWTVERLL